MFLRELHVEHLRAVRRASLRLDASTTLIGENDSGKGSLLRALEVVLGESAPALQDAEFHRDHGHETPSGAPRVTLVFEERTAGEWSGAGHAVLGEHVRRAGPAPRRLVLHATGMAGKADDPPVVRLDVHGIRDEAARDSVVAHIRASTPLIRVSGGILTPPGGRPRASDHPRASGRPRAGGAGPLATLVARIIEATDDLLSGVVTDPDACLEAGATAARELLARSPHHVDPAGPGFASSVLEILGGPVTSPGAGHADDVSRSDGSAERLALLLLLAAILRRAPDGLAPGVEPLWVIEDPDAHLHPMTLAAVERVLRRIRWQTIVTTESGDLLAATPLAEIRRLVRHDGMVRTAALRPRALSREHLRRVGYHLRTHRGVAMFARVWLLVEGESEFWILPQVAQVMGYDLPLEGICCVGFAQCGLDPLIRTAREFGIEWHLLADGDEAGRHYEDAARSFVGRGDLRQRITRLDERDIEHCFWHHGHADTIAEVAGLGRGVDIRRVKPTPVISKAVHRRSKPYLALSLVESVARRGRDGVPPPLAGLIDTCVRLARMAPRLAVDARAPRGSAR